MYPSLMAWCTLSSWESSATNYLLSSSHFLICGLTITEMIIKPLLKHSQCINFLNALLNFGLSSSDHWSQHYQQHLLPLPSCSLTGQHEMDAKGVLCPHNTKELLTLTSILVITLAGSAKAENSDWLQLCNHCL